MFTGSVDRNVILMSGDNVKCAYYNSTAGATLSVKNVNDVINTDTSVVAEASS